MNDPAAAGYWPGLWPCEDGGPRRTQLPPARTPGPNIQPGEQLQTVTRDVMIACMTVSRDPGELYLLGHTGPPTDSRSWIERIDPESLATVKRSPPLDSGPVWPGGISAHANGSLYVTYGRWCHRLDPDCQPVASRMLPRERPYNSHVILPDGRLVMKDFGGGRGTHALPPGEGSELVVLEPENLEIVVRHELPEGSIARLSADTAPDGAPRVYVVGDTRMMRLLWDGNACDLTPDEGWTREYLLFEGQTFGWDAAIEDGYAWFLDNGEGTAAFGPSFRGKGVSEAPLHLVRVPLEDGGPPQFLEVCGEPNGIIANPPAVDASRKIVAGYDSSNGALTAWRYAGTEEPERIWQRRQWQAGHMVLFPDTGELVCYDYDHERGTENCVVLDIETGAERARATLGSPLQCVVFPSIGPARNLYVTTFTTVARVFVG